MADNLVIQMKFYFMKLNKSECIFYIFISFLCIVAAYSVLSPAYERILSSISRQNGNENITPDGGVKIETSIVGACSVGMPEKIGASDIALAMNIVQCQETSIANVQITNTTKKWHRNIEIGCVELARDGTMLNKEILTISEEIPPGATVSVKGLVLKSIAERAAHIECAVLGAERF